MYSTKDKVPRTMLESLDTRAIRSRPRKSVASYNPKHVPQLEGDSQVQVRQLETGEGRGRNKDLQNWVKEFKRNPLPIIVTNTRGIEEKTPSKL